MSDEEQKLDNEIKETKEKLMQLKKKKLKRKKKTSTIVKEELKCLKCNKTFSTKRRLKHHSINICSKNEWKCSFCDDKFISQTFLDHHLDLCRKRKCPMCNYRTAKKKQLQEHIKSGICTRLFKCHICFRELKSRNYLKTHYKKKHHFPPDEAKELAYKDQNQT